MKKMNVVYVAGPFRPQTPGDCWEMEQNIRRAEELSLQVWRMGCAAICPHSNTRFFQGAADDSVWLDGDLELLSRCDAILMTDDWERSVGARAERNLALELGIRIFYSVDQLGIWLRAEAA